VRGTFSVISFKVQVWIWWATPQDDSHLRVLLLKTHTGRGDFWQPVTGGVDPGEALPVAALREATEETGLKFDEPPELLGKSFRFEHKIRTRGMAEEQAFSLRARGRGSEKEDRPPKVQLDPSEHEAYEWLTPSEALTRVKFESNRELLEEFLKSFKELKDKS
jgi:8-oxo-dGTP pyrophosphatase MutT (NUDIX family)